MTDLRLAALWMRRGTEWHEPVSAALRQSGFSMCRNRWGIEVWQPDRRAELPGGGYAVDGWQLRSLWLGPQARRKALGVRPKRIYLRSDGSRDRRPERQIIDLHQCPRWPLEVRRRALTSFLERLQNGCAECLGDSVALATDKVDLLDGVRLLGSSCDFPADTEFRDVHKKGGFLSVPDPFEVRICCDDGVDRKGARDSHRAEQAFRGRGAEASFGCVRIKKLMGRIDELDQGDPVKRRDVPVLFLLANKQEHPSSRLSRLMRGLDRHGLPWRRCACAPDNRKWSVSDQTGSLLQAAGGHPHGVVLASGESLPWSIGIDSSHRDTFTRVAAVLVSPEGRLAGSWMLDQEPKEDIIPKVLRRLLVAAVEKVPTGERSSGVMIVRDGRVFESENVNDYMRELGTAVTLVELRKYGNPPLLLGPEARLPTRPTVGWLSEPTGGSLGFLVPLPSGGTSNGFGNVLKIWMKQAWDEMRLGPEQLARILFAQTLTPGLGLRRRWLPAPIYWADGIAGASDDDLRFRGQCVVNLKRDRRGIGGLGSLG